jgi:hypothetical protein
MVLFVQGGHYLQPRAELGLGLYPPFMVFITQIPHGELEFLRPTDSRPVRLGIGPPFGSHDQIYISLLFWTDNYFFFFLWHPL